MKWFGHSKKKEAEDYEKDYVARIKKQHKTSSSDKKPKPSIQKIETKSIVNKSNAQDIEIEIKNSEPLSKKLQIVKEEYNEVIRNLMNAKKEQKIIMEKIQKSNNEYEEIISKMKLLRGDLLQVNNELVKKKNELSKITDEYKKHSLVIQEINNSKKEVLELKSEIKNYNNELECVKAKTDNFPVILKMREEKKKLENEIGEKRNYIKSSIRELKFIQNEIANAGKTTESTNVVDAASAVVASMKQKLQSTQKELDLVRKALEEEKERKDV